jgi:hypothetical protein
VRRRLRWRRWMRRLTAQAGETEVLFTEQPAWTAGFALHTKE